MPVKIEIQGDCVVAHINDDIDHHNAIGIRSEIDSVIEREKPKTLILDYQNVSFMDSSGIGLVMGRYKLMRIIGGELKVVHLSNQFKRVMRLAGIDKLTEISR